MLLSHKDSQKQKIYSAQYTLSIIISLIMMKNILVVLFIVIDCCLGHDLIVSGYNTNLSIFSIDNDSLNLLDQQYFKVPLNLSWLDIAEDPDYPGEIDVIAAQEVIKAF